VARKARKWKVDRSDTSDDYSGYRRNTLTSALERIYGAGSLDPAAGPKRRGCGESRTSIPKDESEFHELDNEYGSSIPMDMIDRLTPVGPPN